jgi:hypothetical protein
LAVVSGLPGTDLDVAVGGLGLGYTALTVLKDGRVRSLVVVEALPAVIDWHRRALVPAGAVLTAEPRCRFVLGDFMAMNGAESGLDPQTPGRRFDAIIVDIDHSPSHLLHPSHGGFYEPSGLGTSPDISDLQASSPSGPTTHRSRHSSPRSEGCSSMSGPRSSVSTTHCRSVLRLTPCTWRGLVELARSQWGRGRHAGPVCHSRTS